MRATACMKLAAVGLAAGLVLGRPTVSGAQASSPRQWLTECAVAYGNANFDEATGLVKDNSGRRSVATASPGYVAAALAMDSDPTRALRVLEAVLAHQDQAESSPTRGQFPWSSEDPRIPSLRATCLAVPVLAYIYQQWVAALPGTVQQELEASLRLALTSLRRPSPSSDDVSKLLRAASLAMLAAALNEPTASKESLAEVNRWLTRLANEGMVQGHSPTADTYRLAALKWIWHSLAAEERPAALQAALEFSYRDLAGRVQTGSGALAGAALHTQPGDYLKGKGDGRYLIHADLAGPQPTQVDPFAMFFTLPQYSPPAELLAWQDPGEPHQVVTAAQGEARITRTDTYVHPLFSLGTMSGQPALTSIPLLATFARGEDRPTAYFFTRPQANHVSSVQKENVGLITADFDDIGTPDRRMALLYGVLGPRSQVEEVYLGGQPWNGEPAAVAEMGRVAVSRGGCYLGVTVLRAGPAEATQRVSGPRPGVLRWSGDGPEAELQLIIYGRKADYVLRRPLQNVRAGVAVEIQPGSTYPNLAEFAQHLAAIRLRQTVERTKERITESADPRDEFLHGRDPKPKSALVYEHKLIHALEYQTDQTTLQLQEEMLRGAVLGRQIDGEDVVTPGPWASDELLVPWRARPEALLTRHQQFSILPSDNGSPGRAAGRPR